LHRTEWRREPGRSTTITPPSIEYSQLAPMLVVFGAALAGVLVEAFAPRPARRIMHLVLTLGALAAAFVWTIVIASDKKIFGAGPSGTWRRWARSR